MKALIGLGVMVVLLLGLLHVRGRYQALAACTELENRLDEAARPPGSMTPVSEDSVRLKVSELASAIKVQVEGTTIAMFPLTAENAGTVSVIAAQAVGVAQQLRGYKVTGQIVEVTLTGRAHGFLHTRRCEMTRRLLVPSG